MLTAAVAAMALSALAASSATATIVPAKFSSSTIKMTTTGVTVKKNGLEPTSCTLTSNHAYEGFAVGSEFTGTNGKKEWTEFTCPSGKLFAFYFSGKATYDTVTEKYTVTLYTYGISMWSPWGSYTQSATPIATWVNGSGATASTLTFNNPTLGYLTECCSKAISMEGTFKATTLTGGLITLSH